MKRVAPYLSGGLGNQLFQFGAAIEFGRRFGYVPCFDPIQSKRTIFEHVSDDYFGKIIHNIPTVSLDWDLITLHETKDDKTVCVSLIDIPPGPQRDIVLYGYFQQKSCVPSVDYLRNYFYLDPSLVEPLKQKYSHILENHHTIAVHIRRGDYLKFLKQTEVSRIHNYMVQTIQRAATELSFNGLFPTFVFFSDDIEWVKENFNNPNFVYISGNKDYEDLWLMCNCRHRILANSSFSWFGAYLSFYPQGKTYAPYPWIDTIGLDHRIFPDSWTLVGSRPDYNIVNTKSLAEKLKVAILILDTFGHDGISFNCLDPDYINPKYISQNPNSLEAKQNFMEWKFSSLDERHRVEVLKKYKKYLIDLIKVPELTIKKILEIIKTIDTLPENLVGYLFHEESFVKSMDSRNRHIFDRFPDDKFLCIGSMIPGLEDRCIYVPGLNYNNMEDLLICLVLMSKTKFFIGTSCWVSFLILVLRESEKYTLL